MSQLFNILIVDDIPENRYSLKTLLERLDQINIIEAESGEQTLALVIEQQIDLILLDIQMPEMDGYEIAKHLKMTSKSRDIPIIFVTAVYKSEEFAERGYKVGAIDYLTKPIDDNLLLNRISHYMKLFQREQNLHQALEELKQKEEALQETNKELEFLIRERTVEINQTSDSIITSDQDGKIIFWNKGAQKLFNYTPEEIMGKPIAVLIPETHLDDHAQGIKEVLQTGQHKHSSEPLELMGLRKDQSLVPIETSFSSYITHEGNRIFSCFIRDITKRTELERSLRVAKVKAEYANQSKSSFLATMSHEIRTPISGILGITNLLTRNKDEAKQKKYLDHLKTSGESLLNIINDILDLSKIEANHLQLEIKPFSLHSLLNEIIETAKIKASNKNLNFILEIDENIAHQVESDSQRIRQILTNLVDNALKYTKEGTVNLNVKSGEDDNVVFMVKDTGIGIPANFLDVMYDSFTRADNSTSSPHGGTGLGLTICQKLAKFLKGSITIESKEDQGTTVNFTVPLPAKLEENVETPETSDIQPHENHLQEALSNKHILLVEDLEVNRIIIEAYLDPFQCNIKIAENGLEAVEAFQKGRFDLVLMDIKMPLMDGYEATAKIRSYEKSEGLKPTPIISITAHAMPEEKAQSLEAGCNYHLTKPVKRKDFLKTLLQFLT